MLQSEGYAPFILDLDDLASGTEKELGEILLQPGCALRGVVVDEAGGAVSGARVFLGEEADLDLFEPQLQTGDDGSFELIGVASAARTLVVRAPGYAWQAIELSLPYDVLKREPMRIQLDRGSTIIALLGPDSEDVRYVELYRNGRLVTRAEVDADGKALFANRARGTYELRRYDDDRAPITVTIEQSGKEVQVDLQ